MGALTEGSYEASVERITLSVGRTPVDAIHARPKGSPLSGVVVSPDIGGIRPLFDDICLRLASHGFSVCAVEPFARVPADDRAQLGISDRLGRVATLYDEVQLGDLSEAADYLEATDGVPSVSMIGFCMGGYYAFKAAATGRFERAVPFYGMLRTPEAWVGPGHSSPLDLVADACPALAVFGEADPWTPAEDIDALRSIWEGRPDHKVVVYPGADHGFVHDPDRPAHREADAADAWRRAMAFLLE